MSDPNVRLCLRRLGDSCNGISQRLVAHAATATCENEGEGVSGSADAEERSNSDESTGGAGGSGGAKGGSKDDRGGKCGMREVCVSLAYQLFSASLVIFEAVGDISNAAMVRCNLSSLLRSRATWEMARYTALNAASGTDGGSGGKTGNGTGKDTDKIDKGGNCGDGGSGRGSDTIDKGDDSSSVPYDKGAAFKGYYARSLRYLKEARKHCDLAVASFDDGNEGNRGERDEERNGREGGIPKGSIRNAVALETAQNCLNIGECSVLCFTACVRMLWPWS